MNKVQVNMMTKLLGRDMIERKLEEMGEQSLTDFFLRKQYYGSIKNITQKDKLNNKLAFSSYVEGTFG